MKSYSWNSKVFSWAWGPTWKGMIGNFGLQGSSMLVSLLYTKFASVTDAACFLFSSNMMNSIVQIPQVPFSSLQPKFSRLLASGENSEFSSLVKQRILVSLLLLAVGIVSVGLFLPIFLDFISSNVNFLDFRIWLLFGVLTIVVRFNVFCCAICAIGNEVIYHWELITAAALSSVIMLVLEDKLGFYGPILVSSLPILLILNKGPFHKAKVFQTK